MLLLISSFIIGVWVKNSKVSTFISKETVDVAVALLISGLVAGVWVGYRKGTPFIGKEKKWSIGIYTGESSSNLVSPQTTMNPVLTAKHVTDIPAKFVADLFMLQKGSMWYMFFKVLNAKTNRGVIGLVTSNDELSWTYERIVLEEPFHLSYPHTFSKMHTIDPHHPHQIGQNKWLACVDGSRKHLVFGLKYYH